MSERIGSPGIGPESTARGFAVALPLSYEPICRNQTGMPLCIKPLRDIFCDGHRLTF